MPLREMIACVLMAIAFISLVVVYRHLTAERRILDRCERTYRRLQERRKRLSRH